jgi:hypothetical protein
MQVWQTTSGWSVAIYLPCVHALQPKDYTARVDFCQIVQQRQLVKLFCVCVFVRWDNQLPRHTYIISQQSTPLHCKQLPASLFGEHVVLSY